MRAPRDSLAPRFVQIGLRRPQPPAHACIVWPLASNNLSVPSVKKIEHFNNGHTGEQEKHANLFLGLGIHPSFLACFRANQLGSIAFDPSVEAVLRNCAPPPTEYLRKTCRLPSEVVDTFHSCRKRRCAQARTSTPRRSVQVHSSALLKISELRDLQPVQQNCQPTPTHPASEIPNCLLEANICSFRFSQSPRGSSNKRLHVRWRRLEDHLELECLTNGSVLAIRPSRPTTRLHVSDAYASAQHAQKCSVHRARHLLPYRTLCRTHPCFTQKCRASE